MISSCCLYSFSNEVGVDIVSAIHDWRIVLSQFTSINFVESCTNVENDYFSVEDVFLSVAPDPSPQLVAEPRSL